MSSQWISSDNSFTNICCFEKIDFQNLSYLACKNASYFMVMVAMEAMHILFPWQQERKENILF